MRMSMPFSRSRVAKRVGGEAVVKTAHGPRAVEGHAGRRAGQMRRAGAVGEQPLGMAMGFPDGPKHTEDRLGQGQGPLLVALADDPQEHLFGIDGGDGKRDGFADAHAGGVDQPETAAIDRLLEGRDQAAALLVASDIRKALAFGLADFFFVRSGHS